MPHRAILSLSMLVAIVTFVASLASMPTPPNASSVGARGSRLIGPRSPLPDDPDELERFLTERPDDLAAWMTLAFKRRSLEDSEGERRAWVGLLDASTDMPGFGRDLPWDYYIGWAHHGLGQDPDAQAAWTRALATLRTNIDRSRDPSRGSYNLACLRALTGDADGAIEDLERAVSQGFGNRELAESDPDLESLHGRDDFARLLRRMSAAGQRASS